MNDNQNKPTTKFNSTFFIFLILLSFFSVLGFVFRNKIKTYLNPVSIVANVTSASLKETDGRTNVLILGSDKRTNSNIGSNLTDTILVASIGKVDKDVVLISLPRDLWVNWESSSGVTQTSKINAIYAMDNKNAQTLMKSIEEVLGLPIHYYGIVNFDLFEKSYLCNLKLNHIV